MAAARRPRHYYASEEHVSTRSEHAGCGHRWPPGRWGSDHRCKLPADDPIHFQRARRSGTEYVKAA